MKKIDFVKKYCEIIHYPEYEDVNNKYYKQYKQYWCCTEGIVGNFAGRALDADSPEEAILETVRYFDRNSLSNQTSIVSMVLKNIGWKIDSDDICESLFIANYLTDSQKDE